MNIPVTVMIMTKNEEGQIGKCLAPLSDFDDIIVIDSNSTDKTREEATAHGARVENFTWNGQYPKKRQWCLDHLKCRHDWILFVDADEIVTPELVDEIRALFAAGPDKAGYFIRGRYILNGKTLRHGLHNNKIAMINKHKICFPVIDDLDLPGMGEIEGHYQPTLKPGHENEKIGQLRGVMMHHALDDETRWLERHKRYAAWETGMNARQAWPKDPIPLRQTLKQIFRNLPGRGFIAFIHAYLFKGGFLDGRAGYAHALRRGIYYELISSKR